MKKFSIFNFQFSIIVAALIFVAFPVNAATIKTAPTNGLIGWWKMDEWGWLGTAGEVRDWSGKGNHGTISGSANTTSGKLGRSGAFDGSSAYITGTGSALPNTGNNGSITILAWIKPSTITAERRAIFVKGQDANCFNYGMVLNGSSLYARNDSHDSSTLGTVSVNTWQHVAVVFDGANGSMGYVNGSRTGQDPATPATNCAITKWAISRRSAVLADGQPEFFNGLIDDVRVYNRALTADEVKAVYNSLASTKTNSADVAKAASPTVNLQSGLVGHWTFDAHQMGTTSAFDLSGNKYTGWLVGGVQKVIGKVGQGVKFNGTSGFVDVGNSSVFTPANFTISAWIKIERLGAYSFLISNHNSTGNTGYAFALYSDNKVYLWAGDGVTWAKTNVGSGAITTLGWHHIVATNSGSIARVYVDGVLSNTQSNSATIANSGRNTWIQRNADTPSEYHAATIDEIRIYSRALSQAEVTALYKAGGTEKTNSASAAKAATPTVNLQSGLVGYWPFDASAMVGSTVALDKSGQNNHGTLTGGVTKTAGKIGQGLKFDGRSGYVDAGNPALFNTTFAATSPFSISSWVKTIDSTGYTRVLHKALGVSPYTGIWFGKFSDNSLYLQLYDAGPTAGYIGRKTTTTINDGKWHHVVATYSGSQTNSGIKLYIDGISSDTADAGVGTFDTSTSNNSTLKIGADAAGIYLPATIDDVRIYNRVLSQAEVTALYRAGR